MENILEFGKVKSPQLDVDIDKKIDVNLDKNRNEFSSIISNVIDKGGDYIIKAMPINNNIKDILVDVKQAFKTKDFKTIVSTAVNSSIREGLEILSIPKNVIADITKIKDIAFKGGISEALSAGIDLVTKKYLKGNLFTNFIGDFITKMKDFVFTKSFSDKIDMGMNKILNKSEKYLDICNKWYEAYEKFDVENINSIAKTLDNRKRGIEFNNECSTQNRIIQNMTNLINSKKDKLSQMQFQICNEI